ncbi:MAG: hypothetical protein ACTSRA_20660, partial [Promethearchaeota archaeon]
MSNEKEERILRVLENGPLSPKELKEEADITNESTFFRKLNSLVKRKLIEKEHGNFPNNTRVRYKLTNEYYQKKLNESNRISINKDIVWRENYDKFVNYLESQYIVPIKYLYGYDSSLMERLHLDCFSYLNFFQERYPNLLNEDNFFDTVLYLVFNHPDKHYEKLESLIKIDRDKIYNLINRFIEFRVLERFSFTIEGEESRKKGKEDYYLIQDDPILYNIRKEIETTFLSKFLLIWRISGIIFKNKVKLKDNFSFFFNFSYHIYDGINYNLKDDYNRNHISRFLRFKNNNKFSLLIYIREKILEYLENTEINFPIELLELPQKKKYRLQITKKPVIWNKWEINEIKLYFNDEENKQERIKEIKEIVLKIQEEIKNPSYKNLQSLILKSHLLHLLRIFYHLDKDQYKKFINEYENDSSGLDLHYSKVSDDFFNQIKDLISKNKFQNQSEYNYFLLYHMIEKMDHLNNKFEKSKSKNDKAEILNKIKEIVELSKNNLPERVYLPILIRKCELFLQNYDFNKVDKTEM